MESNLIARWKKVFADLDAAQEAIDRADGELANIATADMFDQVAFRFEKARTALLEIDEVLASSRLTIGPPSDDSFDAKFKVAIEAWAEDYLYHHAAKLGFVHDSEIGSILRDSRSNLRTQGVVFRDTIRDDVLDLCDFVGEDYVAGAISDAFDEREFIDTDDVNGLIEAALEERELVDRNDVHRMIGDVHDDFREVLKHAVDGVRVAFMRMSEEI